MVTFKQFALMQSPISSLIPSVGNIVTVKLDDSNYVTWNFQMELFLEGNGILGFLDGTIPCLEKFYKPFTSEVVTNDSVTMISKAYKIWKIHYKALMTLIAALSFTLSCIINCQSSKEMWTNLRDIY